MYQLARNKLIIKIKRFYRTSFRHDKELFLQIPKSSKHGIFSLFANDLVCKYYAAQIDINDFKFRRNIKALSKLMHCDDQGNYKPSNLFRPTGNIIIGRHLGIAICDESRNLNVIMEKTINDPIHELVNAYHEYVIAIPFQPTIKDLDWHSIPKSQLQVIPKIKHEPEIDRKHRYNHAKFRKK